MQEIQVYSLPSSADASFVESATAIVIDVLRATSVIAMAVNSGAKEIFPVLEIDDAFRLKREIESPVNQKGGVILGGERKGLPIVGFDLGNSPQDYTPERVAGKSLVFTTTNGTVALHAARPAKKIVTASFLNAAAVVRATASDERIAVFCAGTCGVETEEDLLLAGCLVSRLRQNGVRLNLAAEETLNVWEAADIDSDAALTKTLRQSRGGRNLIGIGLDADIAEAARCDSLDVLPKLDPTTMRIGP